MKKVYKKPEFDVVDIMYVTPLLAGSGDDPDPNITVDEMGEQVEP